MRSVTTSKVFIGRDIPKGGLRQTMLHSNVRLHYVRDVLLAPRVHEDKVSVDISTYFIADAIQRLYPNVVAAICGKAFEKEFQMPQINRLEVKKVESHILGAIPFNEGTLSGNYKVHESIFLEQLGCDQDRDFADVLYLVYGDQKTTSLNRSIKNKQRSIELPFDRKD
jgi:hypothetical protein